VLGAVLPARSLTSTLGTDIFADSRGARPKGAYAARRSRTLKRKSILPLFGLIVDMMMALSKFLIIIVKYSNKLLIFSSFLFFLI
jgi:hypothetical protein